MPAPFAQQLDNCRWTAQATGDLSRVPAHIGTRTIPATIPGCIHTDLMDAALIPDPAAGTNEPEVQWVSWTDWRDETEFEADAALFAHDEIDLVFDCLDTIATIELNGVKIGDAASEFIPHRFSVLGHIKQGKNRLAVTFKSPLRHVHQEAARLGPRPVNGDYDPFVFIRKCASNFQWDWGPRAATCGITRRVQICAWSKVRLAMVRSVVEPENEDTWNIRVHVDLQWSQHSTNLDGLRLFVCIDDDDVNEYATTPLSPHQSSSSVTLVLAKPEQWHPVGRGTQRRYPLETTIRDPDAPHERGDHVHHTIGLRTTRLVTDDEGNGAQFTLFANGSPIFCKGVNWIPEGLWPRDRTPERIRQRLQQLLDANMNTLRVWGGGRYEPDWFYDLCDEMGILVWHDFMFACGCYPEEEPIWSLVEQEARHQIARLSRHPSVVLWCGGNECIWGHESWGWKERLKPGQTWGERYYHEMLPRLCAELNPAVPYWPNSPWSGDATQMGALPPTPSRREGESIHPNNNDRGDQHVWDAWGDGYRTITPRFCSEFGHQGPSNFATLQQANLTPNSPSLREGVGGRAPASPESTQSDATPQPDTTPSLTATLIPLALSKRQLGPGGNKRWHDDPLAAWFRPPRDFDEWHYLTQLIQARSLQIGIEWHRANMPRCMGSLIWQLNDAWPGLSWSLIDPAGRPKPAYFTVQSAFRNRRLTIQPLAVGLSVVAINDTDVVWQNWLDVRRMTFDGAVLAAVSRMAFEVPPRTVTRLCEIEPALGTPADASTEFVVAQELSERATWFYLPDRELRYPAPRFSASVTQERNKVFIEVRADTFIRDLLFQANRVAPRAFVPAGGPRTVLSGEKISIGIHTAPGLQGGPRLSADELLKRPVMWCANHFGKPPNP